MLADSNILIYVTKPEHAKLCQWFIDTLTATATMKTAKQANFAQTYLALNSSLANLVPSNTMEHYPNGDQL